MFLKRQWARAFNSITLIALLALTGCDLGIGGIKSQRSSVAREQWEKNVARIDNIKIDNPSLSYDGRFMAFDFRQFLVRDTDPGTHTSLVGVYDFETNAYSIIAPFGEKIGFHSPSFNKAADKLVMVSHCFDSLTCEENIRGNQIVRYDLKTKEFEWLTSFFTQGYVRNDKFSTDKEIWPYFGKTMIRGYPIFSLSEKQVYSVIGYENTFSNYLRQRLNGDFSLVRLTPTSEKGEEWDEELLINAPDQHGYFLNGGRLSIAENGKLSVEVGKFVGNKKSPLKKESVSSFFYDIDTDRLSIAFDETNSPVDIADKHPAHKTATAQHVQSRDGTKIAFSGLGGQAVFIRENSKNQKLISATDLQLSSVGEIHMSGDGKWLVILPDELLVKETDDLRSFWRINLETKNVEKFALRQPILKLIQKTFPGGKA